MIAEAVLVLLVTGSVVFCALALIAGAKYRKSAAPPLKTLPPVSILRPMAGDQDNTEEGLRSVFTQNYPRFEVVMAVPNEANSAAAVARKVMAEFPQIPSRLVFSGESPLPNAKVWQLRAVWNEANFETIVMADSDIRWQPDSLATVVSELGQPNVALVTCPYRAFSGGSFWTRVEAIGLNTDFMSGLMTARMLNGVDFAIGCTVATRKAEIEAIGGLEALQPYLSEDFVMGNRLHKLGREVVLSRAVIDHYIGNDGFRKNWAHRLRWARGTRRSRPAGYVGELFMKPTVLALALWIAFPVWWPLSLFAGVMRMAVAISTATTLRDPLFARYWWLLPFEDVSAFMTWLLGFFGNTLTWRGRRLTLNADGTVRL